MKLVLYILIALLPSAVFAQFAQGVVTNEEGKALQGVIVVNKKTLDGTTTDEAGHYKLRAKYGDTIVHMLAYYETKKTVASAGGSVASVKLATVTYTLDEVVILPELEKYEREHAEMLQTYKKTFEDARRKPKANVQPTAGAVAGITIDGAISELAARISGKKKKDKRFVQSFEAMELQKLLAIRYNPDLVMQVTGATRDSAITFINAHTIEPDFAFNASMLELMMWIREQYTAWSAPAKQKRPSAKATD